MNAVGDETKAMFTLNFDPAKLSIDASSFPSENADITLGVADLGAACLGGVRFTTLARAGRVVERTPGALARADAAFASEPSAYCSTDF